MSDKQKDLAHLYAYGDASVDIAIKPTYSSPVMQQIAIQPFTQQGVTLVNKPNDQPQAGNQEDKKLDEKDKAADLPNEADVPDDQTQQDLSDESFMFERNDDAVQVVEEDNEIDEVTDEAEAVSKDVISEPGIDSDSGVNTIATTTTTVLVTPTAAPITPTASSVVINSPTLLSAAGNIDLGSLTAAQGVTFTDDQSGQDSFGISVATVGDIDGDGLSDFVIGAVAADGDESNSGVAYVVKGSSSGVSDVASMTSLDGSNGFRIDGYVNGDKVGLGVNGGGDVNGDGFADVIIGARGYNNNEGRSHVLYGKSTNFTAEVATNDIASSYSNGIYLDGPNYNESRLGFSNHIAADINGDGFDDIIVGAPYDYENYQYDGIAFVTFGGSSLSETVVRNLNGTTGFKLEGNTNYSYLGQSVSAGDVNGDGFDDLIVGAPYAQDNSGNYNGNVYVMYGAVSGFSAWNDAGDIGSTKSGFQLLGENGAGFTGEVVTAADINADGYSDIIIGAPLGSGGFGNGQAYVYFGSASASSAQVNLSGLNGTTGFYIGGQGSTETRFGSSVTAGDFNADGYDDFIVGGNAHSGNDAVAYLIFGKASGWSADLDLSNLSATEGVEVSVPSSSSANSLNQVSLQVSNVGDVDGDGVDDILFGIDDNDNGANQEGAYLIYGSTYLGNSSIDLLLGTEDNDIMLGSADAERIIGDLGDDTITGGGGADAIYGGLGDDSITTQDGYVKIDGGGGTDTLLLSTGNLDLTAVANNNKVTGIERIDLTADSSVNTLTLNKQDVLDTGDTLTTNPDSGASMANSLVVLGDANDAVVIGDNSGWAQGAAQGSYNVFTNGQATLFIEDSITNITGGGL